MALHISVGVGFEEKIALRSPPGSLYTVRVVLWMGMNGEELIPYLARLDSVPCKTSRNNNE